MVARRRGLGAIGAVTVAVALLLVMVPVAFAHALLEEKAEAAAERYAAFQVGGGARTLSTDGPSGGRINLTVDRYDSGKCARVSLHRRSCPVAYEGRDLLEEDCRLEPLASDPESGRDCFEDITCSQLVTVTLRTPHRSSRPGARTGTRAAQSSPTRTERDLTISATDIECSASGDAPEQPPAPEPAP